jgi:hypothetical protein
MQAFFVLANGPSPNLVVANSARRYGVSPYKSNSVDDLLKLTITGNGLYDMMFVNFNKEATAGIDSNFDSPKILGNEDAPQLYSMIGEEMMSVNTLSEIYEELIVPVGLEVSGEGEYTIFASELNTFESDVEVYLEDIAEGMMIDLNLQEDYSFMASQNENSHRFNLHFYKSSVDETVDADELYIYSNANSVYIRNIDAELNNAIMNIYNISGQKVYAGELANIPVNKIDLNLESGYYIVKVITSSKVSSQKVFIR